MSVSLPWGVRRKPVRSVELNMVIARRYNSELIEDHLFRVSV